MRVVGRGLTVGLVLGLALASVGVACSNDGTTSGPMGPGGSGAVCQSGQQSCVKLEDCPEISCRCPGVRFPVTIQRCSGGCCPRNCEEACPSNGTGGSGGGAGEAGQVPTGYGQDATVDWLAVAGSDASERVERVALRPDGRVAALAELPQGGQTVFNAGQPNEIGASGRAL